MSKPVWLVADVLKHCGVPMAECIAQMLCKKPVTPTPTLYLYGTPSESGNIGLRNGESVTLYDGAVLPELPEWDKTVYPYAVIVRPRKNYYNSSVDEDYPVDNYRLYVTSSELIYDNSAGSIGNHLEATVSGTLYCMATLKENGEVIATPEWETVGATTWYNVPCIPVWSNYTMVNNTDWEVPEASDPIPVSGIVGYSYNGTVLPELPEWDKTAYPYASIWNIGIYTYLWISSQPQYIAEASRGDSIHSLMPNIAYSYQTDRSDEGWLRLADNTECIQPLSFYDFIWCNAPIEKDGTVVYEKTDPIPVYE